MCFTMPDNGESDAAFDSGRVDDFPHASSSTVGGLLMLKLWELRRGSPLHELSSSSQRGYSVSSFLLYSEPIIITKCEDSQESYIKGAYIIMGGH